MLNIRASLRALAVLTFICTLSAVAQAQATRTWVEGAGGDDVNPCSRTAPCKTFAGAISKTATSGIINVISSGSYGSVTITKHLTIDGGGQLAAITNSLTPGITVNDSATATPNTAVVSIRNSNLSFNGGAGLSLDNSAANSATVDTTELNHNTIGLFVGTGTTVRLGSSIITQNSTNFSNSGTILSFCDNKTDTNPIPGAVSTSCLK